MMKSNSPFKKLKRAEKDLQKRVSGNIQIASLEECIETERALIWIRKYTSNLS